MAKEPKVHMQHKKLSNAIAYVVLILISIIWLFPFVCLVLQSFRSYILENGGMVNYLLPKTFSLDSYKFLFSKDCQFFRWYGNTFTIAFFVTIFQTIFILSVSYALSRMRFKGREMLMRLWLVLGMFPGFLSMICLYFLLKEFGWAIMYVRDTSIRSPSLWTRRPGSTAPTGRRYLPSC